MHSRSVLGQPWRLGAVRVRNRLGMAPMCTHLADGQGCVTPRLARHLVRRAEGGCGLVVLESATVDSVRGAVRGNLRLDADDVIEPLQACVHALHDRGAVAVAQLWHAGPRAHPRRGLPLSPSPARKGEPAVREMTRTDIDTTAEQFTAAADRAVRAGCDAVELHAAHGYLLHCFLDHRTNRRGDGYGGSPAARLRILCEIRARIAERHSGLPVLLRASLEEEPHLADLVHGIAGSGFAALDLRTGFSSMARGPDGAPMPPGYTLALAAAVRPHLPLPLLTGGRILTPGQAENAVLEHGVDVVLLGRPLLADPDWACRALTGESVSPCHYDCDPSCYDLFKAGRPLGCTHAGGDR